MAVNVSLRQLDGNFAATLQECLEQYDLPADALHVEVTESVLLDISKSAGGDLNAMAAQGVCLGIDDFGTGYSSLLYLKRFPVCFLKIDRSFVDGLPHDPEDTAIVEAIVRLGQSLGLAVIAEGVETAEQLAALKALRCTAAQGYYVARPLPPEACSIPAP
jgi:EAL domain-containing protein (putative c-di-GMP-specific phosphodiesterase class I)